MLPIQRTSEDAVAAAQQEKMSPKQKAFVEKAQQTVNRVVIELLKTIAESSSMKWPMFVATFITPKQQALSEIDDRTCKFFIKMMDAINPSVEAVPLLMMSFQTFGAIAQDAQIGKKLVEGIALPHVKTLIAELDQISPSIVEDVINA